jgi:hypothetical protein
VFGIFSPGVSGFPAGTEAVLAGAQAVRPLTRAALARGCAACRSSALTMPANATSKILFQKPRWRSGCPPLNPSGAGARLCRVPLIRAGCASKRNEQNLISKNRIQALAMIGYTNYTSRRVKSSIQPYPCRHSRREQAARGTAARQRRSG